MLRKDEISPPPRHLKRDKECEIVRCVVPRGYSYDLYSGSLSSKTIVKRLSSDELEKDSKLLVGSTEKVIKQTKFKSQIKER